MTTAEEAIKAAAKAKGITKESLQKELGLSYFRLQQLIAGKGNEEDLRKLCSLLGIRYFLLRALIQGDELTSLEQEWMDEFNKKLHPVKRGRPRKTLK